MEAIQQSSWRYISRDDERSMAGLEACLVFGAVGEHLE